MKVNTYGMKMVFNLKDEEDLPVDLSSYDEVNLYIKIGDTVKAKECVIEDAGNGQVSYTIEEGDLDSVGTAKMEIEVVGTESMFVSENKIYEDIKWRIKEE